MLALNFLAVLAVILMISILWTNLVGAPWLPTARRKVHRMLDMAEVGGDDVVYDLGCGDGRTLVIAARTYGARAIGIEIDPMRYVWCELLVTVLGLRGQVTVIFGNIFDQDLQLADVVTCYLLPETNRKLEAKLRRELKPQARVVSHDFTFPGLRLMGEDREADLYLYHPLPRQPS
mgnify:CR=1 FL=1